MSTLIQFIFRYLILLAILMAPSISCHAVILIEGHKLFKSNVENALSQASVASPYLDRLVDTLRSTSILVAIEPITDDPATWHPKGNKTRSHTKAIDALKRGAERSTPTDSIIFINPDRVTSSHKSYKSGTFVHELVHATDLALGLYHDDYKIREKRAVFFQNIWRAFFKRKLRSDYHDRFVTLDYQESIKSNRLDYFVNYYFSRNDIPSTVRWAEPRGAQR